MSKQQDFRDFVLNHEFDQFAKDEEGRAIFHLWQDEYEAVQSAMASVGGGLSSIAQKKLEQMGATVHGVLVKNEAGAWAAVSDLGRVTWLESDNGEDPPAEHTSDYSCPDCGAKMTQASPDDPDCDVLHCNECGFNKPADSEDGVDIDDCTKPIPEKNIDPLFEGPDVPIEDALGAMEEERSLNEEHLEDALDSAISGQSKQDCLIDSVNAELCSMAYDMMLSHTISGEWPASEAAAKAKHDQLLAMVEGLRGLKGRSSHPVLAQAAEPVFWWDGDMSDLDDCVRKEQSAWHTIPLYTCPSKAQEVPEWMADISGNLKTQDNRITADPLFAVFQKSAIVVDEDYDHDRIVWIDDEGNEADAETVDQLNEMREDMYGLHYMEDEIELGSDEREEWRRLAIKEVDQFVTACFTEAGANAYLKRDGHNLNQPFIFVTSLYRNEEMKTLREWLISTPPADKPEGERNHD